MQIPPRLRRQLEWLPFPMRFSDGRIRLTTARMALLRRMWWRLPGCALESRQALAVYYGGDVLDVGAFHGWYTVLLAPVAKAGDRFVSFEPDPEAVPVLRAMLGDLGRRFPSIQVSVVTQPVGDGAPVVASRPAGAAGHLRFGEASESGATPSLTVDEFVAQQRLQPRLVKVDVEGAELSVLHGMRSTLSEHRPALILEVHPSWQPIGVDAAAVEDFVRDAGYEGSTFDEGANARRQVWLPSSTIAA